MMPHAPGILKERGIYGIGGFLHRYLTCSGTESQKLRVHLSGSKVLEALGVWGFNPYNPYIIPIIPILYPYIIPLFPIVAFFLHYPQDLQASLEANHVRVILGLY